MEALRDRRGFRVKIAPIIILSFLSVSSFFGQANKDLDRYIFKPYYVSKEIAGYIFEVTDSHQRKAKDGFLRIVQTHFKIGQFVRVNYWAHLSRDIDFSVVYDNALIIMQLRNDKESGESKVVGGTLLFLEPISCGDAQVRVIPQREIADGILFGPFYRLICDGKEYMINDFDTQAFDSKNYMILKSRDGVIVVVERENDS